MRMNADDRFQASADASESVDTSRRSLFALAAATPLLILGLASRVGAQAQQAPACYNEAALPAAQKSMRRSLGFKAVSPDQAKTCGGCNFFSEPKGGCGKCALLTGGIVPAAAVCDSWAKKA